MHTYKIVETKEDPMDNVIEKSNITHTFTIREIEAEERQTEKTIKEFEGKVLIESSKVTNIETHHPFVKELTDEQLFTVHMYEEARAFVRVLTPKIAEMKQGLIDSKAEREEIYKQTGVPISTKDLDDKNSKENNQKA